MNKVIFWINIKERDGIMNFPTGVYKKFVTPDFATVILPNLRGTEKQIAYANSIRDKYTNIFIRKVQLSNPLGANDRMELTEKFNAYVQNNIMLDSYMWIENHCPRCGCYMLKQDETSYCTNDYCSYTKNNAFHTQG